MEKAKLKERIGLAILEKLKKMCEEEQTTPNKLYPQLPISPPPYEGPQVMAPVLDLTATINYKKPDGAEHGESWQRASESRREEIQILLDATKEMARGIASLSKLEKGVESMRLEEESEEGSELGSWTEPDQAGLRQQQDKEMWNRQRMEELDKELKRGAEEVKILQAAVEKLDQVQHGSSEKEQRKRGPYIHVGPDGDDAENRRSMEGEDGVMSLGVILNEGSKDSDSKYICGLFDGEVWTPKDDAPAYHARSKIRSANMMPLRETPGGETVYKHWAHRDLQTLIDSLPLPEESGCRWVKAFDSFTAADELTIGDMTAVMNRCMGDQECRELMTTGGLWGISSVGTPFDPYRNGTWTAIGRKYPTQPRPEIIDPRRG
ncbi:uncharacterized protein LOC109873633 [Oncorhynchus kisutch]|uniref:uncharacterized protein LOC109873633 n=1 Tax=Oncorhynchus kisutch TaxID=8019 RepID=UPI00099FBF34|nr:uncharacterized protein LOC109873633 [Oncorhynchus kisutch]XP_031665254.1 uncharacterized protein LOC109873633 [Oncorhynchus kisutch]XP_031665255.1 uncharacterized protein LOC109873633 [Oncorhynchus kisutch]XP_031665256.1 uncharacterized protein LOC109873633 [Oncorhynchus kisutch]